MSALFMYLSQTKYFNTNRQIQSVTFQLKKKSMSSLFKPIKIKDVILKNRIAVSPMCQYKSVDGFANDWHLVHLGSRAVGGAGLIIIEATAVSPEGRITPDDLGLWKDEQITGLKKINEFIEANDCVPGIQLAHAGRKASHTSPWKGNRNLRKDEDAWETVSASNLPYKKTDPTPISLDKKGIQKVVNDFSLAAKRAKEAGFKVIEIHAAHGYLIHQFYSPLSNHRKDEYGGNFMNRIKLLMEIVDAVKKEWPDKLPLFVRISATDYHEDGWTIEDSIVLAKYLQAKGVDLIDCSSGGNVSADIQVSPGYQVPFADRIKNETGIKTGAVGFITTAEQAEEIITSEKADIVFLARQLLRDPYFPLHAAKSLGVEVPWPLPYLRANV